MSNVFIIDTHIHIYPASEVDTLAWCSPGHKLRGQFSIEQYKSATKDDSSLRGFVFVETDRVHHLESEAGWEQPLSEVEWIMRVAAGKPRAGEGHLPGDWSKCLAIVPWAPIPLGGEGLARYVEQVNLRAGEIGDRIVGFRYLLQGRPKGTMLQAGFIDGLRWLGERRYSFDLGVDCRSGGLWQLDEAIEMIRKVQNGVSDADCLVIVINHLCKPDMMESSSQGSTFAAWSERIDHLAKFSNTFMKLSGVFSEMPPIQSRTSDSLFAESNTVQAIKVHVKPWCDHVIRAFGSERVMFGSDWPVCTVNGGSRAWPCWKLVLQDIVIEALGSDALEAVFSGNAAKAYRIPRL